MFLFFPGNGYQGTFTKPVRLKSYILLLNNMTYLKQYLCFCRLWTWWLRSVWLYWLWYLHCSSDNGDCECDVRWVCGCAHAENGIIMGGESADCNLHSCAAPDPPCPSCAIYQGRGECYKWDRTAPDSPMLPLLCVYFHAVSGCLRCSR